MILQIVGTQCLAPGHFSRVDTCCTEGLKTGFWLKSKSPNHYTNQLPTECEKCSLPGGVQVSMGDWTKAERLLVGMGSAIFCSLCLASAACTASVWMSKDTVRINRVTQIRKNISKK